MVTLTGFNIKRLRSQFELSKLFDKPTRRDLVLTSLPQLYDKNSAQILPQFGLSDHNVVILNSKTRGTREGSSRKQISRCNTRAINELELGRYLFAIVWSVVDVANDCEGKLQLLKDFILTGLDSIMPIRQSRIHANDTPRPSWVSPEFKHLKNLSQRAFSTGVSQLF